MTLILFNKPYGVVSQFTIPGTRSGPSAPPQTRTLRDYLPQRGIYPAGRLDADSEGLLVLTDDGRLQHRLTDPRQKLEKTYFVQVEGLPPSAALAALAQGVSLGGAKTLPARVRPVEEPAWLWERTPPIRVRRAIPTAWLEIRLVEGKNRQVRRMTAAVGHPTLRLIRYAVGPWSLEGLAPGCWQEAPPPASDARPRGAAVGRR